MRVVLDTNCFLVSISRKSIYRPIFDALLSNKFELVLSIDILLEYEEVIAAKANPVVSQNIRDMLLNRKNIYWQEIYFQFNLISKDPDDNKFVDIFVASNADYLVTNDTDYSHLKSLFFPKINVISIEEFQEKIAGL